jgi:hypothetical protein
MAKWLRNLAQYVFETMMLLLPDSPRLCLFQRWVMCSSVVLVGDEQTAGPCTCTGDRQSCRWCLDWLRVLVAAHT